MSSATITLSHDRVLRRASVVSSGLQRLGIGPSRQVAVLVCDCHEEDRSVALRAISLGANRPVILDVATSASELTVQLLELRGSVLFACAEGAERWRATGVPMRVIGDGRETIWWKAFELREMSRMDAELPAAASA